MQAHREQHSFHAPPPIRKKPLITAETGTDTPTAGIKGQTFHQDLLKLLPDLRGFARFLTRDPSTADDLVQDAVMRALVAQTQFTPGTSLKAWLFTIQRNVFYEQRRRSNREREVMDDFERDIPESDTFASLQNARDAVTDLSELLWKLPPLLREALILVGAQELSYDDAASICDVPSGTMKARVSRARQQLSILAAGKTEETARTTE